MAVDEAVVEGEEVAPKSKKKMIIILAALVVLAGGGAAWFFMQPKADHKAEVKHEEVAKAPVFLPLEAFTVNLQPDPDEKFLQLDVSLQLENLEEVEKIKAQMPAIRSRLLLLLSSKHASEISTSEGKKQLTDEIIAEMKKPLDPNGKPQKIMGVFFTSFVIQ